MKCTIIKQRFDVELEQNCELLKEDCTERMYEDIMTRENFYVDEIQLLLRIIKIRTNKKRKDK